MLYKCTVNALLHIMVKILFDDTIVYLLQCLFNVYAIYNHCATEINEGKGNSIVVVFYTFILFHLIC